VPVIFWPRTISNSNSRISRPVVCQGEGHEFEPRLPLENQPHCVLFDLFGPSSSQLVDARRQESGRVVETPKPRLASEQRSRSALSLPADGPGMGPRRSKPSRVVVVGQVASARLPRPHHDFAGSDFGGVRRPTADRSLARHVIFKPNWGKCRAARLLGSLGVAYLGG
jgi:hypothetical protein